MRRKLVKNALEPLAFAVKPKASGELPARQASMPQSLPPRRKPRRFTTGRNQQLNLKATAQTVERFYRLADEKQLTLCETLELALDALERSDNAS